MVPRSSHLSVADTGSAEPTDLKQLPFVHAVNPVLDRHQHALRVHRLSSGDVFNHVEGL